MGSASFVALLTAFQSLLVRNPHLGGKPCLLPSSANDLVLKIQLRGHQVNERVDSIRLLRPPLAISP